MIVNPLLLHELLPFKHINKKLAVAGIRDGELVVCKKLQGSPAGTSWNGQGGHTDCMTFEDLEQDKKNKLDNTKNLDKVKNCEVTNKLYMFTGWQNIYYMHPHSDESAVRLHTFFRNMRTVNVCAVASVKVAKEGKIEIIHKE